MKKPELVLLQDGVIEREAREFHARVVLRELEHDEVLKLVDFLKANVNSVMLLFDNYRQQKKLMKAYNRINTLENKLAALKRRDRIKRLKKFKSWGFFKLFSVRGD